LTTALDLFCGAGGSSLGAHWAGVKILVAMNHWGLAIESHSANFGDTVHVIGQAQWANLEALKGVDLLMASPECTRHSTAAGKLKWTPEAEGSRATAWQVHRYAAALKPRWLVVENVRQIQLWKHYGKWIEAIRSLGYNLRTQLLNAADFGVPQSRIRWFLTGDRLGQPPEIKPTVAEHTPAYKIIDWSLPCASIFGKKKQLADNTMRRVMIGLKKFCSHEVIQPFITMLRTHSDAISLEGPTRAMTSGGSHLLTVPYLVSVNHADSDPNRIRSVKLPLWTVTTSRGIAVVAPFIVPQMAEGIPRSLGDQLPTVTTTARGVALLSAFITTYYTAGGGAKSVADALPTITTHDHFGLVGARLGQPPSLPKKDPHGIVAFMREHQIADIGFRMLQPSELQRAMGFPDEYIVKGGKADVVKQLGNAVAPPVMRAIVEQLCR